MSVDIPTSSYCSLTAAVIQILPDNPEGKIDVGGRQARKVAAYVILPTTESKTISCPFDYFQKNASLQGKWIEDDYDIQRPLQFVDNLTCFFVTILKDGNEERCCIPESYQNRLLNYFMLDIPHNELVHSGFDCFALVSLLANVDYCPENPPFAYQSESHRVGDIIAISDGTRLPTAIKHWALFLGEGKYLSKCGKTGHGSQSLVEIMGLDEMKLLYDCSDSYVASPTPDAAPWNGLHS